MENGRNSNKASVESKMKRKQLTLFLAPSESARIEEIRKKFNPLQYALIKSHITLCREDEIQDLERIARVLDQMDLKEFELKSDGLRRFSDGKGLYISVNDTDSKFSNLRKLVLDHGNISPRPHDAHITLMHPRNSTCDDEKFEIIKNIKLPERFAIRSISLIQQEIGQKWETLAEYKFDKR